MVVRVAKSKYDMKRIVCRVIAIACRSRKGFLRSSGLLLSSNCASSVITCFFSACRAVSELGRAVSELGRDEKLSALDTSAIVDGQLEVFHTHRLAI